MTTKNILLAAGIGAIVAICFDIPGISAQTTVGGNPDISEAALRTDESLPTVISHAKGEIRPGSDHGITNLVGLHPNQVVTVTVQFPIAHAGAAATVEPLDGGLVIATSGEHIVSGDGTLEFQFQANTNPGLSQVLLRVGTDEFGMRFYVLNPEHPERNPRIQIAN